MKSKMTETIQQLKEDISILQEKLRKLEAQDPEMLLLRQGNIDVVDYDGKKYFRIEYTDSFADTYSWYVRRVGEDAVRPVRDVNVYAPLEELYQKEVVKQKDDYPYKKYTPEQTAQSLKEAFVKAQQTENWKEIQKKIDAPAEGIYDNIDVNKLLEKWEKDPPEFLKFELGQTLYDVCMTWWGRVFDNNDDMETCIDDLVDNIDYWLPKEQSAAGSQSLGVEDMVEGFNDCLKKIKGKLR
jgi:hypothetical protein